MATEPAVTVGRRRVRVVTRPIPRDADTTPELEAVQAVLDTAPGWWRRHRARLVLILGIAGSVAGGGYAAGRLAFAAEKDTLEQAAMVQEIADINKRLARMEGAILVIASHFKKEIP